MVIVELICWDMKLELIKDGKVGSLNRKGYVVLTYIYISVLERGQGSSRSLAYKSAGLVKGYRVQIF